VLVFDTAKYRTDHPLERYYSPDDSSVPRTTSTTVSWPHALAVREELLRQLLNPRPHEPDHAGCDSVAQHVFEAGEGEDRLEYVKGRNEPDGSGRAHQRGEAAAPVRGVHEKRDFLYLLDHSLKAQGVQIFIAMNRFQILDECSVITAPTRPATPCGVVV